MDPPVPLKPWDESGEGQAENDQQCTKRAIDH
jgi:hypothetical protein